jgi:Cu-Zn family superoxide dismutase
MRYDAQSVRTLQETKSMARAVLISLTLYSLVPLAQAGGLTVAMNLIDTSGVGKSIGQIELTENDYGVVLTPRLAGLPPGLHGFHVHEKPDCGAVEKDGKMVAGLAAGGHHDPASTGRHEGPWGTGHAGDVPPLYVGSDGTATNPVLAPRLNLSDLKGRSLMIHAGGDNLADQPEKLGGGGARIACGVVP